MAGGLRQAGHTPSLAAALIHFDVSFVCWVLVGALLVAGRGRAWTITARPALAEAMA